MVLTLYGVPASQPVRAVMWACAAGKTPYNLEFTLPWKHTRTDKYMALSPYCTVPRIEEKCEKGGPSLILNEAGAILSYLGEKHKWDLYPRDIKRRAHVHEYLHWHHRSIREITYSLFAPALAPGKHTPDEIARSKRAAKDGLTLLDTRILDKARGGWVAGPNPTVADLMCFCEVDQCTEDLFGLCDLTPYPRVREWLSACREIPGYEDAHAGLKAKALPALRGMVDAYYKDHPEARSLDC
eukprot:TRINITY_DN61565_c0_g1_i1.p2 TRINITY_DN61565_c0_g1~~TRINITY_DN61565_c0_g1_i1.p2  ORF type:complete len:264 (+),score=76.37 TRINITY_DN61565_c0_g1_i1:72-794(+)